MIVTVFRSRLNLEAQEEYLRWAARISELAKGIPGYISHQGFVAQDGERVTIVEFETEEGMRAWATHPEHVEAKKMGYVTEFDFRYNHQALKGIAGKRLTYRRTNATA